MTTSIIRPVGYTGTRQQMTWPTGWQGQIIAHLFGAGGGGSGGDGGSPAGRGQGGGYSQVIFNVLPGDTLECSIGRWGDGGVSNKQYGPGSGGPSMSYSVFNTRTTPASPPVVPVTFSGWNSFMNDNAVWNTDTASFNFIRTYSVNFPYDGTYTIWINATDAQVTIDGVPVISTTVTSDYPPRIGAFIVNQGLHTVGIIATRGIAQPAAGVAVEIRMSFSGANGVNAGPGGSSGAGGGGGGATVLFKNGELMAVAAGGSGAGGAGVNGGPDNNAPGPSGNAVLSTAGQEAEPRGGDGGGGGGGGGGYRGGNGGAAFLMDNNAYAGGAAVNYAAFGGTIITSYNRTSAGAGTPYYVSGVGEGGAGTTGTPASGRGGNGYMVLELDGRGIRYNDTGTWREVVTPYVNLDNVWRPVSRTYINNGGFWTSTFGSVAPTFTTLAGGFGYYARPYGQG